MNWFHNKPLGTIGLADIERLIADKVRESRTLDYKVDIPDPASLNATEKERRKTSLAKDLACFANTSGGDLVIGVREVDSYPVEIVGFTESFEKRREYIQSVALDSIEPGIVGLGFRDIEAAPGKNLLVVRVPQSLAAPHRVEHGDLRFWSREESANQHVMSSTEIKALVTRMATLKDRAEAWHTERWMRHRRASDTGKQTYNPIIVVCGYPLSAGASLLPVGDGHTAGLFAGCPRVPEVKPRRTIDGIEAVKGGPHPREARWYRDGRFELVDWIGDRVFRPEGTRGGPQQFSRYAARSKEDHWVKAIEVERMLDDTLTHATAVQTLIGETGWLFYATLVGVEEHAYVGSGHGGAIRRDANCEFDRHNISVPPILAEKLPSAEEPGELWTYTLDVFAQAANWPDHQALNSVR